MPVYRGTPRLKLPKRTIAVVVGGGSPAYVFRSSASTSGSGAALSTSIDIGTASADRLVIVGCVIATGTLVASVVVNGVTLTADDNTTNGVAMFSGLVTSGSGPQTVTVTWVSGSFNVRGFSLWTATGLSSNLVKQHATGAGQTGTINVTAGDLMFGVAAYVAGSDATWTSSTQSPAATHVINTGAQDSADWTIVSTNASFALSSTIAGASGISVATYR